MCQSWIRIGWSCLNIVYCMRCFSLNINQVFCRLNNLTCQEKLIFLFFNYSLLLMTRIEWQCVEYVQCKAMKICCLNLLACLMWLFAYLLLYLAPTRYIRNEGCEDFVTRFGKSRLWLICLPFCRSSVVDLQNSFVIMLKLKIWIN